MANKTSITVDVNVGGFNTWLGDILKDKFPKAMAGGLNDAAFQLRTKWMETILQVVDRPAPFTVNSVFVDKATADALTSRTYLKDIQANYLGFMIEGFPRRTGDTSTTRSGAIIPVDARLDNRGNFPKGPLKWLGNVGDTSKTDKSGGVFVGSPFGKAKAVWERGVSSGGERHLHLLAVLIDNVAYKSRLPLPQVAATFAEQKLNQILQARFDAIT